MKTNITAAVGVAITAIMFFVVWFHFQLMARSESLLAVGITAAVILIAWFRFRPH